MSEKELDRLQDVSGDTMPNQVETGMVETIAQGEARRVVTPMRKTAAAKSIATASDSAQSDAVTPQESREKPKPGVLPEITKLKLEPRRDLPPELNKLLPPLPQVRTKRSRGVRLSFLLCVVLPSVIVAGYFAFFAANQYVAEFRFAVSETTPTLPGAAPGVGTTGSSGASPLASLAGLTGVMGGSGAASMQNYVVIDYLLSRQAVDELERRIKVKELYSGPNLEKDWWARFDSSLPTERFILYWNRMVTATYDMMTGLAVVKIRAFSPESAQLIAQTMVTLSEDLVNDVAKRPLLDAIRYAEGEVTRAQERVKKIRADLTQYRYKEGVVDPSGSVSGNVDLIKALRLQIISLQTDLAALGNQQQNTNAAQAQALRSKISATKAQLAKVEKEVGQDTDANRAIADVVARYEQLDLDRQYAQAMLVSTMQGLDQARANAAAQHLYLTPYVRPALPESSIYPKRIQSTILAALAFLAIWMIGVMVVRSIREHL